jgi:hypothetical protein
LEETGMSAPEGCAALVLAYVMWIEAQPDGDADKCESMLIHSLQGVRATFGVLRDLRAAERKLLDEAMQASL